MANWADIIKVETPSGANAGDTVIADVSVKNISSSDQYIAVTAVFDSTSIPFQFDYLLVAPGQTVIFRGWFTMPSKQVRVTAWSWYWTGSAWSLDDTAYADISLTELVPAFSDFAIVDYRKVS